VVAAQVPQDGVQASLKDCHEGCLGARPRNQSRSHTSPGLPRVCNFEQTGSDLGERVFSPAKIFTYQADNYDAQSFFCRGP
jgi:hypothetical protein